MSARTYNVVKWQVEAIVTERDETSKLIVSFSERGDLKPIEFTLGDMSGFTEMVRDTIASPTGAESPGIQLDSRVGVGIKRRSSGLRFDTEHNGETQMFDLSLADAETFVSDLEREHDEAHSQLDEKLEQGVEFIAAG